ncbi:MAG: glycoside hydrolase family 3 C-terminal domain-containing protein [Lachnospiraceae bacterium]|nr:glycoside hydrolase family 3 C-terminal domain-containing protein [Lachnospiraceae bacterium]
MGDKTKKMYEIKASFSDDVSELERKNRQLARRIATEAIVLLKNDGTLPLSEDVTKIALYGNGARRTIYGGNGSGEVNSREQISIEDGLLQHGVSITTNPWLDRYEQQWLRGKEEYLADGREKIKKFNTHILAELIASEYQYPYGDEITEDDLIESDTNTCLYVISRQSGEGRDRTLDAGDYKLTNVEIENLKKCATCYEKCILVINIGSSMDMSEIEKISGVNAIVYMSLLGMESGNALADVLFGNQTPSGHLTTTWAIAYEDYPGSDNFGSWASDINSVCYTEEGQVGYRYFDSKNIPVQYPFGYGLSYTSFETIVLEYGLKTDTFWLKVKVKNVGKQFSGKEVLGVYVGKKHRWNHEEPSKILVGFGKTDLLNPGEETDVFFDIPLERMSVFDESTNLTKICEGEYNIYMGADVSACQFVGTFQIETEQVIIRHDEERKKEWNQNHNEEIERMIETLSAKELIELCVGNGLLSDGKGFQVPGAVGCTSTKFLKRGIRNILMCDGPAGVRLQRRSTISKSGKIKPLDFPLSFYELLPGVIAKLRLGNEKKDQVIYQFVTGFPVANAVAQTWNKALCQDMGIAVGKEMEKYGVTLWLAPAINIIRNPLCGRNYEYFSEDPVLTGDMATGIVKGVQTTSGRGVTIKHFACNNQETNRYYMSSNMSEKTLREIYLKPFEIVVKNSTPAALMTAYNKVNGVYAAENVHLLNEVLKKEWNYQGLVMTDWLSVGEDRADEAKSIHAGVDLIMPGSKKNKKKLYQEYKEGFIQIDDLQRAARNVLTVIKGAI